MIIILSGIAPNPSCFIYRLAYDRRLQMPAERAFVPA